MIRFAWLLVWFQRPFFDAFATEVQQSEDHEFPHFTFEEGLIGVGVDRFGEVGDHMTENSLGGKWIQTGGSGIGGKCMSSIMRSVTEIFYVVEVGIIDDPSTMLVVEQA